MFMPPPRRQSMKKAYPRTGFSPSFAKATAGARTKRTGINRRSRRNSVSETGK
jgi:hypothetical protein